MAALTLAIPSKGRLKEKCDAFFVAAGLSMQQTSARGYRAAFAGVGNVEILLLSASEIASSLVSGDVHLGITGEDLLREEAPELTGRVALLKSLGFGNARVVVAVSEYWIDVDTMADLDDICAAYAATHRRRLRVATKYARLTRQFFAQNRISDYRIVPSAGATEGAPAAGAAEVIVDITTTGATLKGNGLKILADGLILDSYANLAASLSADWTDDARAACKVLLNHLDSTGGLQSRLSAGLA
jgi:ATP phosphoribosyltransferase